MADRSNPYVDRRTWGVVEIGGYELPGIVLSIDGADRPEEWDVQKPTDKSGAASVWKGTRIADSIKIKLALTDKVTFDGYLDVRTLLRPKMGEKPPTLPIVNGQVNFNGIAEVACRNVAAPKWVEGKGYWEGLVEVVDFKPAKKANTGTAGAGRKPAGTIKEEAPDPNAGLKKQLAALLDEAKKP